MSSSAIESRTLHGRIREQLRDQYLEQAGVALPPLRELSRQLGVNHATVTRALRDLEKEGMVEIVPRKGIFSTSPLNGTNRPGNAQATGAIELTLFASPKQSVLDIATALMEGIERAMTLRDLSQEGVPKKLTVTRSILHIPPLPTAQDYVKGLRARGVGAVAFLGHGYLDFPYSHQESAFLYEVSRLIPTVLVGAPHSELKLQAIFSDPRPQLESFLQQSYDAGLRRFEYIGMRTQMPHQRLRYEAFCRFVMQHGLTWQDKHFDNLETADLAAELKNLDQLPEVVVAANISRGLTFILEAQRRGLQLPDDIKVLCFASSPGQAAPILPYAHIALLDEAGVGERAMQILLQHWNEPPHHYSQNCWETIPATLLKP
jgi:DNA-binding transcriptional ArsR family regulator